MTISKKFLKHQIQSYKEMIEAFREEAKTYPQLKKHNEKTVLRLEGGIQVYESFLKT